MGYDLRRKLREALGPEIAGLQRAVALEIADDAKDGTRESWATLDDLARWTAAKDASVVRNALKRLAAAGWEFRVPIGKGKDGRVLYAVPGTRMTFMVPPFEGVATASSSGSKGEPGLPLGGAGAPPSPPQGGAGAPSEGAGAPSEGAGAPPYSSNPSAPQQKLANKQKGEQRPALSDIPDDARPLVDQLTAAGVTVRWPFRGNDWFPVLACIQNSGVPAMVEHAIKASSRTSVESARYFMRGWAELPPIPAADVKRPRPRVVGSAPTAPRDTDHMTEEELQRALQFG